MQTTSANLLWHYIKRIKIPHYVASSASYWLNGRIVPPGMHYRSSLLMCTRLHKCYISLHISCYVPCVQITWESKLRLSCYVRVKEYDLMEIRLLCTTIEFAFLCNRSSEKFIWCLVVIAIFVFIYNKEWEYLLVIENLLKVDDIYLLAFLILSTFLRLAKLHHKTMTITK